MPAAPKRVCNRCRRGLYDSATRVCTVCGKRSAHNWQDDKRRGTRQQRGYGKHWLKLRAVKLATDPWCEECGRQGKRRFATTVDHIVPFAGVDDPRRLEWSNLQSLCLSCHKSKTARESRRA